MKLVGSGGQLVPHYTFDASGSIASATLPQMILPRSFARSHFIVQNLSATAVMYLEIGSARAVATITNGAVSAVTVTNAGFGFSLAPRVQFRGGGASNLPGFLGSTEPNSPPPFKPAAAHCVMTGAAPNRSVASITIDNPGSGYLVAPFVLIQNDQHDPNGCADPSAGGGSGILLNTAGGSYYVNGTVCTTDALALFCATAGQQFTCKWMD